MIHWIWAGLITVGVVTAALRGEIDMITNSALASAQSGIEMILGLLGIMVLWLGLGKIAEEAGLIQQLAKLVAPLLRPLFPSIPRDHPALGSILMNTSANMLGLGSAATPFGLKAMQQLQELNKRPGEASDAMCTFLALNTSGVTIIPATVIALRAAAGSANPGEIVTTALLATACASAVALAADYTLRRLGGRRGQ